MNTEAVRSVVVFTDDREKHGTKRDGTLYLWGGVIFSYGPYSFIEQQKIEGESFNGWDVYSNPEEVADASSEIKQAVGRIYNALNRLN
jgi:hypothetical protein